MSASVYYQPIRHNSVSHGPSVARDLKKVFGDLPLALGRDDLDKLMTLDALWSGDDSPYSDLMSAISEFGAIRVWTEY